MIVLDTSVFVDAVIPFEKGGCELANNVIGIISGRGLSLYGPRLLAVELSGVLVRFKAMDAVREHVDSLLDFINI